MRNAVSGSVLRNSDEFKNKGKSMKCIFVLLGELFPVNGRPSSCSSRSWKHFVTDARQHSPPACGAPTTLPLSAWWLFGFLLLLADVRVYFYVCFLADPTDVYHIVLASVLPSLHSY